MIVNCIENGYYQIFKKAKTIQAMDAFTKFMKIDEYDDKIPKDLMIG